MSYGEEKLLQFFGQVNYNMKLVVLSCGYSATLFMQLLGVAIRADVPFPLDLLSCFWKSLLGCPLDREEDLREADILTHKLLKNLVEVCVCMWNYWV